MDSQRQQPAFLRGGRICWQRVAQWTRRPGSQSSVPERDRASQALQEVGLPQRAAGSPSQEEKAAWSIPRAPGERSGSRGAAPVAKALPAASLLALPPGPFLLPQPPPVAPPRAPACSAPAPPLLQPPWPLLSPRPPVGLDPCDEARRCR